MYKMRPGTDRRGDDRRRHRSPAGGGLRPDGRDLVAAPRGSRSRARSSSSTLGIYGFFASVLPVWLLLAPRDYLSAFMKIGTVALARRRRRRSSNPVLQMPALTRVRRGAAGRSCPGTLFPFAFITIACGAISGFHSLVGSGTTPKMIDKETRHPADRLRRDAHGRARRRHGAHRRRSLHPGDYFAINTPPAVFATLNQQMVDLPDLEAAGGRNRSPAGRAAPCRWPSAWRRSSAGCRACAA